LKTSLGSKFVLLLLLLLLLLRLMLLLLMLLLLLLLLLLMLLKTHMHVRVTQTHTHTHTHKRTCTRTRTHRKVIYPVEWNGKWFACCAFLCTGMVSGPALDALKHGWVLVTDSDYCRDGKAWATLIQRDGANEPLIHAHGANFLDRRQWRRTFPPTLENLVNGGKGPYLVWWECLRFYRDNALSIHIRSP
jgi:hypothetical protein